MLPACTCMLSIDFKANASEITRLGRCRFTALALVAALARCSTLTAACLLQVLSISSINFVIVYIINNNNNNNNNNNSNN